MMAENHALPQKLFAPPNTAARAFSARDRSVLKYRAIGLGPQPATLREPVVGDNVRDARYNNVKRSPTALSLRGKSPQRPCCFNVLRFNVLRFTPFTPLLVCVVIWCLQCARCALAQRMLQCHGCRCARRAPVRLAGACCVLAARLLKECCNVTGVAVLAARPSDLQVPAACSLRVCSGMQQCHGCRCSRRAPPDLLAEQTTRLPSNESSPPPPS